MTPELAARVYDELLPGWRETRNVRGERRVRCPFHADEHPSFDVSEDKGTWICRAGCGGGGAWDLAIRLRGGDGASELLRRLDPSSGRGKGERGFSIAPARTATVQPLAGGLTLAAYAATKGLPQAFLRDLGLGDCRYQAAPAVRIPYFLSDRSPGPIRYRVRLEKGPEGDPRFKWRTGSKALPYGLWRLDRARSAGYLLLVEGESDCHTLWFHGVPALGIPGAGTWRAEWCAHLDAIATVYFVVEPGDAGEKLRAKLYDSPLRGQLRLVEFGEAKDPSGLYLASPEGFREAFDAALARARPATELLAEERATRTRASSERCASLARAPSVLERFVVELERLGIVGEQRLAQLLYLAVTSRLLDRPVSVAVKGPSSAGKSFTVEKVLRFMPAGAYYALSAMSERALAYSDEPLAHRMLVLYEAVGLGGDFASYLVRSLLSEGCVRYETVEKTSEGMRARLIERPGPTGLIVTTTAIRLHPENETRMLSVPTDDTPAQTSRVLAALASTSAVKPHLSEWHALQEWLEGAERQVVIPYAGILAEAIPPLAVRLRRDFGLLLTLVCAHALLHQATRERDAQGRIVATIDDYSRVRDLVIDLIGEAVQATVSATVRETVQAVEALGGSSRAGGEPVSVQDVAKRLGLDKSAASRRARVAVGAGYLRNQEERRGRPARLVVGDPLPEERELLPTPESLAERLHGCSEAEGGKEPPSPPPAQGEDRAAEWEALA